MKHLTMSTFLDIYNKVWSGLPSTWEVKPGFQKPSETTEKTAQITFKKKANQPSGLQKSSTGSVGYLNEYHRQNSERAIEILKKQKRLSQEEMNRQIAERHRQIRQEED